MKPRTAWTLENIADWVAKYDVIHKAGTMRAPYDYGTWLNIIQRASLDYVDTLQEEE